MARRGISKVGIMAQEDVTQIKAQHATSVGNAAAQAVAGTSDENKSDQLHITAATANVKLYTLPWSLPLAEWPKNLLVNLPRGISRHIVRFVQVGKDVDAMKEISRSAAEHEYAMLRQLRKLDIPCVEPIAVVTGRHNGKGEPLEAILITKHLRYSLPYRALFARNLRPDTATKLVNALAVLLVRLHLVGFYWGDVSLSNVLFLRDADQFGAYLVDAETGSLYAKLTDGQRNYDLDIARTNIIGELMDLDSGNLLARGVDEVGVGNQLVSQYNMLWKTLTGMETIKPNETWRIEQRVSQLNKLGFDVDELDVHSTPDGNRLQIRPMVVDAGYASRKLMKLTGLDVQENQARRLLNDLDTYKASTWQQDEDDSIVATDWMREVYEPTVRMIPDKYKATVEPAQFFHDVLTHRWYMGEQIGHDVPMAAAVADYIKNVLPKTEMDSKQIQKINAEADAGVIDDESVETGDRTDESSPNSVSGKNTASSHDAQSDSGQHSKDNSDSSQKKVSVADRAIENDPDAAVWASSKDE